MGFGSLAADALAANAKESHEAIAITTDSGISSEGTTAATDETASQPVRIPLGLDSVLVKDNFANKVMRKSDLSSQTRIKIGFIKQRIVLPVPSELSTLFSTFKSSSASGESIFLLQYLKDR